MPEKNRGARLVLPALVHPRQQHRQRSYIPGPEASLPLWYLGLRGATGAGGIGTKD